MTQNIGLNEMTTDREILQNYRDDLEHRIILHLGTGRVSNNGNDKNR